MIEAQISIRAACEGDSTLGQLAELTCAFTREFHGSSDQHPTITVVERNLAFSRLERWLRSSKYKFLIAELTDNVAAGYAMLDQKGTTAILEEIYVRPDLRGMGISKTLLLEVERLVRPRGVNLLEAQVRPGSQFYEQALRYGWKEAPWEEEGSSQDLITIYERLS